MGPPARARCIWVCTCHKGLPTSSSCHCPPLVQVVSLLGKQGVEPAAIDGILSALALRSLEGLEDLLGADSPALQDMQRLFQLAEGYGYRDWLVFDASVVRGLAYYTGA